jgi:hypothetical protein
MKQLRNLVFVCTLIIAVPGIALADGGVTQGPGLAQPTPDCTETGCQSSDSTATSSDDSTATAPDSFDSSALADVLIDWLEKTIL